jgi:hypothetical protein
MTRTLYDHLADESFLIEPRPPGETELIRAKPQEAKIPISDGMAALLPMVELGLLKEDGEEADYPGYHRVRPNKEWWEDINNAEMTGHVRSSLDLQTDQNEAHTHLVNVKTIRFWACEGWRIKAIGIWWFGQLIDTIPAVPEK